jgi:hypothetical protein
LWRRAFKGYFLKRLRLRYLNPIRILEEHGKSQGEGFSILAIQCSLIEFIESTAQGLTYHYVRRGEVLSPYEYSDSRDLFKQFLCSRDPFKGQFNPALADAFYVSIRCGLLHEARTKNGWRVWAEGPRGTIVDGVKLVVYRNNFQAALEEFVVWYGEALLSDADLQRAFIRKFDSLCE